MEEHSNERLIESLEKVSSKLEKQLSQQKKAQKFGWIFLALFLPVMIGIPTYVEYQKDQAKQERDAKAESAESWDWYDVWDDQEKGKHDLALKKARYLLSKSPNGPAENRSMARLLVSVGEPLKAKKYFLKAYELWPCEKNRDSVTTIFKLLGEKLPKHLVKENQKLSSAEQTLAQDTSSAGSAAE